MSFKNKLFFILFLFSIFGFSQGSSVSVQAKQKIKHTVEKGESVYGISKKYEVKVSDILELNPKSKIGLKPGMILIIPKNAGSELSSKEQFKETVTHDVLPKETLYGISKKYNVSIEEIKKENPFLEVEGLKIGSKLLISRAVIKEENKKSDKTLVVENKEIPKPEKLENNEEEITHEILPKETKYGISRRYGITIAKLEELNPYIKNDFPIGGKLVIKVGKSNSTIKPEEPKKQSQISVVEVKPQIEEEQQPSDKEDVNPEEGTSVLEVPPLSADNLTKAEFLIQKASENLGAKYKSGATGNGGFDCSGLMYATYKNLDITLPRSSADMAQNAGVKIDKNQAQKGDLIFFATFGKGRVSHVGMITEVTENEIKFIHSSTSAGVIISSLSEAYYAKRFFQINRVLSNEIKN